MNPGKLPGCFSYKWPGYEASPDLDIGPDFVYLDSYKRVSSVCTVVLAQIYYHSAILLGEELTWPIAVWDINIQIYKKFHTTIPVDLYVIMTSGGWNTKHWW